MRITIFLLFTILSHTITAQIISDEIGTLSSGMPSLSINLENTNIDLEFTSFDEYYNGLGGIKGNYRTYGKIESDVRWELSFLAVSKFTHQDGITTLPLDMVGLTIDYLGSKRLKVLAKGSPLPLSLHRTMLIEPHPIKSNAGNNDENDFIIYWELGTRQGRLNKKRLSDSDVKKGTYNVYIEFILTESL